MGATRARIVWTALHEAVAVVAAAAAVGLELAISAVRPLVDLLPDGVDAWNPAMYGPVAAPPVATAMAAAAVPARRAGRIDPATAPREE